MIVSVASGKGGTGKTSVAVNMALSIGNVQLLDCDVEESNAHLFLNPKISQTQAVTVSVPIVNEKLCDRCGECAGFCQYNALFIGSDKVLVFPDLCHSCGGCALVCPKEAISEDQHKIGTLKLGSAGGLELVYGELEVGEPMAVPVIKEVKRRIEKGKNVILDSPPGTSCPVIQTVKDSDFCILVTEPTPFGLHDLKIMIQVLESMRIPFGVVINRAGVGDNRVYEYCEEKGIPILLEIPYERRIAELYSRGIPFSQEMPEWKIKLQALFTTVRKFVNK
ncbi:MAG: ATP-binding protein [Candidatus Bathyarchaeota archaeon]|nr:ATP-binding protein [Candidatus Bathyarchaeota archaeon]MDH5788618.1 ATP-binding protein [Candidatus Bathyarchaeota archaeon]